MSNPGSMRLARAEPPPPALSDAAQAILNDEHIHVDVHPGGVPAFVRPRGAKLADDPNAFVSWFAANKLGFDQLAAAHGALLFRGFPLRDTADFQRAIDHYPTDDISYLGGVAPRGELAPRIFESTRALKEWELVLHQEMAYLPHFPRMVAFFSRQSAWAGGETVLADFRELEGRLPKRLWEEVKARGVRYERNFRAPGTAEPWREVLHKTWPAAFDTEDPRQAEEACRSVGMEPVWREDGSLSTYYTAPGFISHPLSGETVWFNHIASQSMNRRTLGDLWDTYDAHYGDTLTGPFTPTYGDGGAIAAEDMDDLYRVLDSLIQAFRWEDGDLMLVDNIVTAHGRNPYEGQRDLQVALLG